MNVRRFIFGSSSICVFSHELILSFGVVSDLQVLQPLVFLFSSRQAQILCVVSESILRTKNKMKRKMREYKILKNKKTKDK